METIEGYFIGKSSSDLNHKQINNGSKIEACQEGLG